jgi:hypothetical protein
MMNGCINFTKKIRYFNLSNKYWPFIGELTGKVV